MRSMMKALVLTEFGRIEVQERPVPAVHRDQVLIEVSATGICGSDVHGFTGENGRRSPGQVMGHESAGTVAAVGDGVDPGLVGRPVTFNPVVIPDDQRQAYAGREQHTPGRYVIGVRPDVSAAFAEYVVVPARNVVVLPVALATPHGALIEPLAVAVHAARRAGVRPDDAVLVLGGGPIGQSIVLALKMIGARRVVVSEIAPARRALLSRLGAAVLDPQDGAVVDRSAGVLGGPADIVIDAVGIDATLADALAGSRVGGVVCLVGMGAPTLTLDAYRVSTEERTIIGSFTYADRDFTDAAAWLGTEPTLAATLVTREVPFEQAQAAFTGLAAGDDTAGKILIRPGRSPDPGGTTKRSRVGHRSEDPLDTSGM